MFLGQYYNIEFFLVNNIKDIWCAIIWIKTVLKYVSKENVTVYEMC